MVYPSHPKHLQNEVLSGSRCCYFEVVKNPKALEYEVFGLVDVQGSNTKRGDGQLHCQVFRSGSSTKSFL